MAASRPAIDPDEGLAALFQRAHVGARRASSLLLQPQLQDLENVYDLLEAVRSGASAASLGISARDFERICDCALPALRSAEAAAAALALLACPSSCLLACASIIVAHFSKSNILSTLLSGLWIDRLKVDFGEEDTESAPEPFSVDLTAYCLNISVLPRLKPLVFRLLEEGGLLC